MDHQIGQPADLGPVHPGHPDQFRDHVHGQLAGEVGDEVERAPLQSGLEVLEGDGPDVVLHLGHLGGGESLAHQRPHAGVAGWVEGQERHELVGVGPEGAGLEGYPLGVGEPVEVAEGGQDVLVAGQGPEVQLLVAVDRGFGPQAGVDRVGVFVDLVGVGAVGQRRCWWWSSCGPPVDRHRLPTQHQLGRAGQNLGDVGEGHVAHARPPAAIP